MNGIYSRGELYFADLGNGVGSEQNGNRPVAVIQNDTGNRYSPTVIVAAITSQTATKHHLPTHCFVGEECGLSQPSIILLEQLRTVDKQRLGSYIGHLNPLQLQYLDCALAVSLNLLTHSDIPFVLCLCNVCADNFRNSGTYFLHPLHSDPNEKSVCTYCGHRFGFDFALVRKQRRKYV